ncbi:hypothetical protein V6N12_062811 [Hibiscus sabdariffa]|uniref:Uncharacterized protein n=1 Tax=Hibiscus sabdariffa TaxID=183260 RepID=A0ABR2F9X4_9ROSI
MLSSAFNSEMVPSAAATAEVSIKQSVNVGDSMSNLSGQFVSSEHTATPIESVSPNVSTSVSPNVLSSSVSNKHTEFVSGNKVSGRNIVTPVTVSIPSTTRPARPVRNRQLPQYLQDYQVDVPKARKSSHTISQGIA